MVVLPNIVSPITFSSSAMLISPGIVVTPSVPKFQVFPTSVAVLPTNMFKPLPTELSLAIIPLGGIINLPTVSLSKLNVCPLDLI